MRPYIFYALNYAMTNFSICANGCRKTLILHGSTTVHAHEYELTSYDDYAELLAEFDNITFTCNRQEQEIDRLYEEITQLTQSLAQDKKLGTLRNLEKINGKPFDKLSSRQARRKLGQVKSYAKDALWFAEGFGLVPTTLQFETINSHQPVTLDL